MMSAKEAERIVGKKLKPEIKISWPFKKKMVFIPEHPIAYPFFNSDHCYAIVHAGFSHHKEYSSLPSRQKDPYGDYSLYAREIKRLIRNLGKSNELSLFFIDHDEFKEYPQQFLPHERSLMVLTKCAQEDLVFLYNESGKSVKQSKIFPFLKDIGVNEIRFSGEYTWCNRGQGCVRFIAREFEKRGFEIKGVKGCLYPSFSQDSKLVPPSDKEYENVTRKLFESQVEFIGNNL